jgi:hypothetical protein
MLLTRLKSSAATAPAPWFVTGLGVVAALITGLGHFPAATDAAIFSLATAAGAVITAFMVTPVSLSVIGGSAAVILGDFAVFGLHLTSDGVGALVGAITFVLGLALHALGRPVSQAPAPAPSPSAGALR